MRYPRLELGAEGCDNVSMPAESIDLMTAEQLLGIDIPGKSTELVRGRLIVRELPSTYHGRVSFNLAWLIETFARHHRLGAVYGQDTGFKIFANPDTVRAPDVAFIAKSRISSIPSAEKRMCIAPTEALRSSAPTRL